MKGMLPGSPGKSEAGEAPLLAGLCGGEPPLSATIFYNF